MLADLSQSRPRFLMGKRPAAHVFMADRRVFPGGRLERGDVFGDVDPDLPTADLALLRTELGQAGSSRRALAFVRCALRETIEETGLDVAARGLVTPVRYLARAITPPGAARRFDTRFFLAVAAPDADVAQLTGGDGELVDIGWYHADDRVDDLHRITNFVLALASDRLAKDADLQATMPVPFSRNVHGKPTIDYR